MNTVQCMVIYVGVHIGCILRVNVLYIETYEGRKHKWKYFVEIDRSHWQLREVEKLICKMYLAG